MGVEIFAVVVGLGVLVVLVVASIAGDRPRQRRKGDGWPIIPIGRRGDDNDDAGLS